MFSNLLEHLARVLRSLDGAAGLHDHALLVDEVGGADDAHGHLPVVLLLLPHAVGLDDRSVRIGKQGEGETVFLLKSLVAGHAISAHAQHHGPPFQELGIELRKAAGLFGAAGGHVLGVEVENHLGAPIVGQGTGYAVLIRQGEGRGFRSDREHTPSPPLAVLGGQHPGDGAHEPAQRHGLASHAPVP